MSFAFVSTFLVVFILISVGESAMSSTCSWSTAHGFLDLCPMVSDHVVCTYKTSGTFYYLTYTPFSNSLNCDSHTTMLQLTSSANYNCTYVADTDDSVKPVAYTGDLNPNKLEAWQFMYANGEASGSCADGRVGDIIFLCDANVADYVVMSCAEEAACKYDLVIRSQYACGNSSTTTTTTTSTSTTTSTTSTTTTSTSTTSTMPPAMSEVFLLYGNSTTCEAAYRSVAVNGQCRLPPDNDTCETARSLTVVTSSPPPSLCLVGNPGAVIELGVESFSMATFYFESTESANWSMQYMTTTPNVKVSMPVDQEIQAITNTTDDQQSTLSFLNIYGLMSIAVQNL